MHALANEGSLTQGRQDAETLEDGTGIGRSHGAAEIQPKLHSALSE